ncbi:hypothetical protein GLOTRDRAFT_74552 [Gloeophyllum trabeum ATCC 11539]|uniref:F-box domain-containing protein n=1 Tax=Gloeophyllum trabeum (strain ATCC 11539 / FP-39264 / Madison 617) TaxID=670483 RepID=S7RSJ8_GLOTA|nr:uncharacterized protein GLOTRDRAFT_74552 [Gloeophyllum trabeum ATCC 11539]EPQ57640.1 hypothetical protein GLOTRDRAFT_74552 [Gloeophyllum trabeum ATCC 11539]
MILSYNDPATNAVCARVCRAWCDPVLNVLWGEVSDLTLLFRLLGPLWQADNGEYAGFSGYHTPGERDWDRFVRYGSRVRTLIYDTYKKSTTIRLELFDVFARTRPSLWMLPSLKELTWLTNDYSQLDATVLFMHERVRKLAFSIPVIPEGYVAVCLQKLNSFCEKVVARMPNITHLDVRVRGPPVSAQVFQPHILYLIRGLPRLEKIILPMYWVTAEVMNVASKLQNLGTLQFETVKGQGEGYRSDVECLAPTFSPGSFPALWDLSLNGLLSDCTNLLDSPHAPSNLTTIAVHSVVMETATAIQQFFECLARNCRGLQELYVVAVDPRSPLRRSEERITLQTLAPLFACAKLKTLELLHEYPMNMSQEDMEVVATKWPLLEQLKLCSEPFTQEKSTLTLRALLPFARHCPNLEFLGLYVDATAADLPLATPPPFQRLRRLSLGLSSLQEPGPVTIFLARLCPLGCRVESGATWAAGWQPEGWTEFGEKNEFTDGVNEWARRCEMWEEVDRMLPLLVKARLDDRYKMVEMTRKIEDLEARNSVFVGTRQIAKDYGCVVC